jgi:hypothetical protein
MSPRRRRIVLGLALCISLGLGLVGAEWVLRAQTESIRNSEQVDPGLIEHDSQLGWRLASGWSGAHRHHDFEVRYVTDERGFRRMAVAGTSGPRVAFLGDSFTFGWGVGQGETFVERWTAVRPNPVVARNLGVPGTSTDQQVLLLEQRVLSRESLAPPPDVVVLVVCLINDLFDNMRAVPLQAPYGKPYFELEPSGLVLRNVPVVRDRPVAAEGQAALAMLIAPDGQAEPTGIKAWLGRRELCRRLGFFQPTFDLAPDYFKGRYARELDLFAALIERARQGVQARGGKLVVALLAGRSHAEDPESWSAAYQEHLRVEALERLRSLDVLTIDLASGLRAAAGGEGLRCYHPHEGHLNAEGHAQVARLLGTGLP